MNNRVLLIVAGLAVPLVALAVFTQTGTHTKDDATKSGAVSSPRPAKANNGANRLAANLEEAKVRVRGRINTLNNITQEQFDAQQKAHAANNPSYVMLTLEGARAQAAERLKTLESMTPDQFHEMQEKKRAERAAASH